MSVILLKEVSYGLPNSSLDLAFLYSSLFSSFVKASESYA